MQRTPVLSRAVNSVKDKAVRTVGVRSAGEHTLITYNIVTFYCLNASTKALYLYYLSVCHNFWDNIAFTPQTNDQLQSAKTTLFISGRFHVTINNLALTHVKQYFTVTQALSILTQWPLWNWKTHRANAVTFVKIVLFNINYWNILEI